MKTYGTLALRSGETWSLDKTPPHVIIRLKQMFPRIPKSGMPPFHFPNDLVHGADLTWFTSRYPMEMTDDDRQALVGSQFAYTARQGELEKVMQEDYQPPLYAGLRPGMEIRRYQGQAIELLMRSNGLLLGDEVGLGKTYTGCGALIQPGVLPAAVVCSTHLQKQWASVIEKMVGLRVHIIKGTRPYELPPADVYLYRYSQLLGWVSVFRETSFKLVIWDETQNLRTGLVSERGRAAKVLADCATFRLGLTATPIYGYGSEIWQVMQFISNGILGNFDDFTREWCRNRGNGKWSVIEPKALGAYLRDNHVFLRRTKGDVGQQMFRLNPIMDTVEYDEGTVKSAEALAHQLAIKATEGSFEERGRAVRDLDIMMRRVTGVAKAKAVAAYVEVIVGAGEPVLLCGWHREVYGIWEKAFEEAGISVAWYTGSEPPAVKEREKDRFVNGDAQVMIMSLRSGEGLDGLQAMCSTIVFGELDWSPGIHHQCIGRLDREGQTVPVTAIFLVTEAGSDPPMIEVLGLKKSEATGIINPDGGVEAVQSDPDKMKTLVARYLRKRAS